MMGNFEITLENYNTEHCLLQENISGHKYILIFYTIMNIIGQKQKAFTTGHFMKTSIVFLVLFSIFTSFSFADSIFDELISATRENATGEQLAALKGKYKGTDITGSGYVLDVTTAGFTVYVTLIVNLEDFDNAMSPDVSVEVPENNTYIDIAKTFKKRQKVSFGGKFYGIFANTIYIEGDVSITPE